MASVEVRGDAQIGTTNKSNVGATLDNGANTERTCRHQASTTSRFDAAVYDTQCFGGVDVQTAGDVRRADGERDTVNQADVATRDRREPADDADFTLQTTRAGGISAKGGGNEGNGQESDGATGFQ